MSRIPLDIHPRFVSACYLGWTCQTNWTTSSLGDPQTGHLQSLGTRHYRYYHLNSYQTFDNSITRICKADIIDTYEICGYSGYTGTHNYTYKPSRGVKCSAGKAKHWPTGDPWGPSFGRSETMEIIPRRDGNKEYLKPPTHQPMCNSISLKIATDGSMIFGNQPQWALPCQMLPGFIPLGESLRDPKDVLLSNSAEFVQCPDATVSKKKLEMKLATKEWHLSFPHVFGWQGQFRSVSGKKRSVPNRAMRLRDIRWEFRCSTPSPVVQSTELTGSIKLLCLPPEVGRCWLEKLEKGTIFHIEWKGGTNWGYSGYSFLSRWSRIGQSLWKSYERGMHMHLPAILMWTTWDRQGINPLLTSLMPATSGSSKPHGIPGSEPILMPGCSARLSQQGGNVAGNVAESAAGTSNPGSVTKFKSNSPVPTCSEQSVVDRTPEVSNSYQTCKLSLKPEGWC